MIGLVLACGGSVPEPQVEEPQLARVAAIVVSGQEVTVNGEPAGLLTDRDGYGLPRVGELLEADPAFTAVSIQAPGDLPLDDVLALASTGGMAGITTFRYAAAGGDSALETTAPTMGSRHATPVDGVLVAPTLLVGRNGDGTWVEGVVLFEPHHAGQSLHEVQLPAPPDARVDAPCTVLAVEWQSLCEEARNTGSGPANVRLGPDDGCVVAQGHPIREGVSNAMRRLSLSDEPFLRVLLAGGPGTRFGDALEAWRGLLDAGMPSPMLAVGAEGESAVPTCDGALHDAADVGRARAVWLGAAGRWGG